ncbi:hypothetical protein GYMLUDRAFT_249256 [Collybiopsis luxurians FD-317 M1]|uniref:Rhodopsin n=1 Tax=Collybiopsis luxurians FD-317 M1 TaxID=944289 RepID=A0A0D0CIC2_9AGAR|nr:hypothetical protein GYMLUDRAFT_249256 [Collybiopsis luxurians FD-317 M1]
MSVPTSYSLPRLVIVMAECILYGAYAVLFGLAMWILPRKFDIPSVKKFIFPVVIAMFVLATINIAYDLVGEGYAILYSLPVQQKMWMIAGECIDTITFLIADILGDTILPVKFYRVYAVWGFQKVILLPLLLVMLIAKVFNVFSTVNSWSSIDPHISLGSLAPITATSEFLFMVVNALANTLMTFAIAGRVWWISRAIHTLESQLLQRRWYHRTIAVVIESGVIYPTYLIAEATMVCFRWNANSSCLGIISVGLAPTLIAVRIGLGSAYDNSVHLVQYSDVIFSPPSQRTQRSSVHVLGDVLVSSNHAADESQTDSAEDAQEKMSEVV